MGVPYCPSSHTTRQPRMLHMHACIVHCLHRLIPTGHEAMTFGERMGWLPFALSHVCHSFALQLFAGRCDCDRNSSPSPVSISPNFFRNTCPGSVLPRGAAVCTATATVNAWTIFSIIYRFLLGPWLLSVGTCIGRLGYNVAPHLAPGWKRKGARKQKKPCTVRSSTIERYWLHSAS